MAESNSIRVMIVDDHDMVRQGLAIFIQAFADLELVGDAGSAAEALEKLAFVRPDVILTDIVMPEQSGIDLIAQVKAIAPHVQLLALTSFVEEDMVESAIQAGAIGILYKDVSIDDLATAIRQAAAGKPTLSSQATQLLLDRLNRPVPVKLTRRERDVLTLLAKGLNNPEIAARMSVSRATVKTHVSNILSKLDVKSRTEAVAYAMENKLLE